MEIARFDQQAVQSNSNAARAARPRFLTVFPPFYRRFNDRFFPFLPFFTAEKKTRSV
jgi:hypothetical protein